MHLQSLLLRNYRVYRRLELEFPDGLVGIYGPNGSGKSTLIEAIRYALYGDARTDKAGVRSDGVGDDLVVDLAFEHGGNSYRVRRLLRGQNLTPVVQVQRNDRLEASGAREANGFLTRVLGMDQRAFLASVCAQQKELTAFTAMQGGERRRLVLDLLGVSPVERALARVRETGRDVRSQAEGRRAMLPDLDELTSLERAAMDELALAERVLATAAAGEVRARELLTTAREALAGVEARRAEQTRLVRERAVAVSGIEQRRAEAAGHQARAAEADAVRSGLDAEVARLAGLPAAQDGLREHERRREVAAARHELERALAEAQDRCRRAERDVRSLRPMVGAHAGLDAAAEQAERNLAAAGAAHQEARDRYTEARAAVQHAAVRLEAARRAHATDDALDPQAPCPTCGQPLGTAFEQVRVRHAAEVEAARTEHERLAATLGAIEREGRQLAAALEAAQRSAGAARAAEREAAQAAGAMQAAERVRSATAQDVAERERALAGAPDPGYDEEAHKATAAAVEELRALEAQHAANVERVSRADDERALAADALELAAQAEAEAQRLAAAIARLGPVEAELAGAQAAERAAAEQAAAAHGAQTKALAERHAAARRVTDRQRALASGTKAHEEVAALEDDAAHLLKLADLVAAFRAHLVARLSRRLQTEAGRLFAELTEETYEDLEVDPEDYDIRIADGGVFYPLDRFSGSEQDLASLSLRVAISLVIGESAGDVGLLVLDEVLGALDRQRRERMLGALTALQNRFRQVLLVTHNDEVKDLLPAAIEVRPGPGRTASAALLA